MLCEFHNKAFAVVKLSHLQNKEAALVGALFRGAQKASFL